MCVRVVRPSGGRVVSFSLKCLEKSWAQSWVQVSQSCLTLPDAARGQFFLRSSRKPLNKKSSEGSTTSSRAGKISGARWPVNCRASWAAALRWNPWPRRKCGLNCSAWRRERGRKSGTNWWPAFPPNPAPPFQSRPPHRRRKGPVKSRTEWRRLAARDRLIEFDSRPVVYILC